MNPSFYILTIPNRDDVANVQSNISAALGSDRGSVLTPISASRYALARTAAKRLASGRDAAAIAALLSGIPGVTAVNRMSGTDLVEFLHTREGITKPLRAEVTAPQAGAATGPDQWNLAMVNLPEAWKTFPGGLDARAWKNIRVGHIDTGYTGPGEEQRDRDAL